MLQPRAKPRHEENADALWPLLVIGETHVSTAARMRTVSGSGANRSHLQSGAPRAGELLLADLPYPIFY